MKKQVLLTGDRPTGPLHLGHYVGSLQNRVLMQHQYESYIIVADMQALTDNSHNPEKVKENTLEVILDYLAVGIDPKVSNIFLQSKVPQLFELTSYLSNLVSFDYLRHNPTLKTELEQKKINNLGFISYPVSQAADILAFKANVVPVGDDQNPILELTNKVAQHFNKLSSTDFFPRVKSINSEVGRLKGIDGDNKMSKSLDNAIFLKDSYKEIQRKVQKMYTDPNHLKITDPGKIEGNVVFMFLDVFDPDKKGLEDLKLRYQLGGVGDGEVKKRLVDILEELIAPIRAKREELEKNKDYLLQVLKEGTENAIVVAEENLKFVRDYFTLKL